MPLPSDYEERVYAGVLGKIIGVYLGRPFEGWTYERIMERLGTIEYYVHDKVGVPLIVTDDDISGTFTFLRALEDYDYNPDLSPRDIGQSWLNYLIEERTILWWGGMGNSTEHTAFLRLKDGIEAPASGSMALNGQVVSEQIGAQIFIDGWAMICPGDPERAADFARRAGSVSHDGEAIYGAQVVAALEAAAFTERDVNKLIDTALTLIPGDCLIRRLIDDVRDWRAGEDDWRKTREKIAANYGYDKYGGNCHMIPNHGLIIHALVHGENDFSEALKIVNTSGWDTDCNSGNVGCIMGIKEGLRGIDEGQDWRGPLADKIYLPTVDGGRAISDAVVESDHIIRAGRRLAGAEAWQPKGGARYHFEMPGSVQGFEADDAFGHVAELANSEGHSIAGARSLKVTILGKGRVTSNVFTPSHEVARFFDNAGYALMASPALSPGQTVTMGIAADGGNSSPLRCRIVIQVYNAENELGPQHSDAANIAPGASQELSWTVPDLAGFPIASVGVEIEGGDGTIYLDHLAWQGAPNVTLTRTEGGTMWRRAWVNGVDSYSPRYPEPFRIIQNTGTGLLTYGSREWRDYAVSADVTPHMAKGAGIAARVQGMKRYYGLQLVDGGVELVKALDGQTVLGRADLDWVLGETVILRLNVRGDEITGFADGDELISVRDASRPLKEGAIALMCSVGRTAMQSVTISPLSE